jgi:signal transduction histidine kinase
VSDDGPGIPQHIVPRIYEPFFSTKEGGTGLGMSIVHSLVSLHGGSIDLQTGPGGTAFEVALPRWR